MGAGRDYWRTWFLPLTFIGGEEYRVLEAEVFETKDEAWVIVEAPDDYARVARAEANGRRAEVVIFTWSGFRYIATAELPADVERRPSEVVEKGRTVVVKFRKLSH